MKTYSLLFFSILFIQYSLEQVKVTSGKVQRFENFKSKLIDARNIDVWLPDGYSEKEKYVPFCTCMTAKRCTMLKVLGTNKLGK